MCGIVGFCDFNKKSSPELLQRMTYSLNHRGPDSEGTIFLEKSWGNLGLGHRRLSVIDTSTLGSQPMVSKNDRWIIVFNGEIYNFKEIKLDLIKDGRSFSSNSDTEVIIEAFDRWGSEAVNKFIGMFAFAIYDKMEEKIYLLRDRAGVKPLYYYYKNGLFVFASELRSIILHPHFKKEMNGTSLNSFFNYGYVLGQHSIYNDVHKLSPGHFLKLELKNGLMGIDCYWDISSYYTAKKLKISEPEAIEHIKELLYSSSEYRMVSDVPVGIFLSGGYDSTCVTAVLQKNRTKKLKTFTIGFEEEAFNEAGNAKEIASYLGTDHYEYYCTQKEALDIIFKIPDIYDEPFGDDSCIPTALLSQMARQQVKVALSADGGDEVFAGYEKYQLALKYKNSVDKLPFILAQVIKNIPLDKYISSSSSLKRRYKYIREFVKNNHIINILDQLSRTYDKENFSNLLLTESNGNFSFFNECPGVVNDLDKMLCLDYKTYLPDDILTKVDRATMSVGLEGREPLLDHRLVEFLAQVDTDLKYKNGEKKYLLKRIVHQMVPAHLVDRPKKGFSIPVVDWLNKELNFLIIELLGETYIKQQGIFNWNKIKEIKYLFERHPKAYAHKVWLLLMFQLWHKRWM